MPYLHIFWYVSIFESLKKVMVDPEKRVPYVIPDWSARSSAFSAKRRVEGEERNELLKIFKK